MPWVLLEGALGATLVVLLWVTIERAWGRSVAPALAAPREEGACRGCIVCHRGCTTHDSEREARGTESERGGSSCS